VYNQQAVPEKPSSAYYLALIGSIIGIAVGAFLVLIIIGVWIIIANVIVLACAQKLKDQPTEHSKWGTLILVFSVLSLNIISLIGGILALTYTPTPTVTQPYYTYPQPNQPYTQTFIQTAPNYCNRCGAAVTSNDTFCPRCGNKLR
jgi:hypothetical protein